MRFWLTRESRLFIALALASLGLACSSGTPTAPSALSASDAAPGAVTASVSAGSSPAGVAQTTAADTIKITQGTLAIDTGLPGTVTLKGSHGFRFDGRVSTSGLLPSFSCGPGNPCQPGATVAFTATWLGSDIPGTVRLQGDEFAAGCGDTCTTMYIELTGSFVAPAHLTDTASVTVPFAVSGLFSRFYPDPPLELTGRGSVTFTLEWQPFIGGWGISFSSFDFGGGPRSS
jgi:hypothetical protein